MKIRDNQTQDKRYTEDDIQAWKDKFTKDQKVDLIKTMDAVEKDAANEINEVSDIEKLRAEVKAAEEKLKAAEAAEKQKAELAKTNEKAELAHRVEAAYKDLVKAENEKAEVIKKANEARNEAFNKYVNLKNEFITKFGSFHMTFTNNEPVVKTVDKPEVKSFSYTDWVKAFDDFWNNIRF